MQPATTDLTELRARGAADAHERSISSGSRARWSTSIRRPAAKARPHACCPTISRSSASRSSSSRSTSTRFNVFATSGAEPRGRLLDALRLRAAVLPEPGRGRPHLRARRVRRQGHPRRAGRGGRSCCAAKARRASACCSSSARSAAATARSARTSTRRGCRYLINGEPTDRRLGLRDARHPARAAEGDGPRRALVVSGARRVGDRQAARRADRTAARRVAGGSAARPHALHRRPDLRRRRAERRVAVGAGRS